LQDGFHGGHGAADYAEVEFEDAPHQGEDGVVWLRLWC
jgi:hypothetical protein